MPTCKICNIEKSEKDFYKVSIIVPNTCKSCQAKIRKEKNSHRKHRLIASDPVNNKVCNKCKIEKSKSEFYFVQKSGKYRSVCRTCKNKVKPTATIKLYSCHLCGLESKLNILLSSHYRKHKEIPKTVYKEDLLTFNGQPPNICPICNLKTTIPKGEYEYPKYHKECYIKSKLQGSSNPNFKGSYHETTCLECNKKIMKFKSQAGKRPFCSVSCSRKYYTREENRTDAIKAKLVNANVDIRKKISAGQAIAFKDRTSKLEKAIFNEVKTLYPNAEHSKAIGYYVVDIAIDKLIIEVQGDYWHNIPQVAKRDKRKNKYLSNLGYTIVYIWEHEWHESKDKVLLLTGKLLV